MSSDQLTSSDLAEDDSDELTDDEEPPFSSIHGDNQKSDDDRNYRDTVNGPWANYLCEELRNKSRLSAFNKTPHPFVPEGVVGKLVDKRMIRKCLMADRGEHTLLIESIFKNARKAFAIATFARINSHRAMKWFLEQGYSDDDLPIKKQVGEWEKSWRIYFYDTQWKFCAPIFDPKKHIHDFEEALILPVVSMFPVGGEGAFGEVSQYEIHENHMFPSSPCPGKFAVKEIKAQTDTQAVAAHWGQEVKALRMMNELNQEHIVRFITAFRRLRQNGGEEHYVMFEWANGGNLRNLWERIDYPDLKSSLVKDVVKQILGLATALQAAHNLNNTEASYRHGDLKPENILVFKTSDELLGTLKIGDWGEAKFQGVRTEMRSRKTTARFGTRRYEAPEVVTGIRVKRQNQPVNRRSRLYDIWAMGCITLEFIVWLLYGLDGLNKFHQDVDGEAFYQISIENGRKVARVHDAAVRWMDHMSREAACEAGRTAIGDLLELVRNSLLVVNLPRRMGSFLPDIEEVPDVDRPRADSFIGLGPRQDPIMSLDHAMLAFSVSRSSPPVTIPTLTVTEPEAELEGPVQPEPETPGPRRCLASDFMDRMDRIWSEDDTIGYWDAHKNRLQVPVGLAGTSSLHVVDTQDETETKDYIKNYDPSDLDEHDWKLRLDTEAASTLFSGLRNAAKLDVRQPQSCTKICDRCDDFRTKFGPTDSITYNVSKLQDSAEAKRCDVCVMLWKACKDHLSNKMQTVQFVREGAFVKMEHNHDIVLSLVRDPKMGLPVFNDYQVGFVELPAAGETTHLEVVRSWLNDCDNDIKHTCRTPKRSNGHSGSSAVRMPTRLIDVGVEGDKKVYLREMNGQDAAGWIALSHKWGEKHYFTRRDNLELHLGGLDFKCLPATFRDAVKVTRALGHRFLWIDSLCIIQGDDGDFETEAKRMEDVYSGAYCVIAASCASDHYSGFLRRRRARNYVGLTKEGKNESPFYICENIDNFQSHVLDGDLNSRGWVLQEHALARRTIFFTEHQTYFECSAGVRCETSTKLENAYAAFLGDADFPNVLYRASQGDKIVRIQELYKKYSTLGLSKSWDRPVAIDGLQKRLLRTLRVAGDFGILDEGATRGLLRRSLLWRRHADEPAMSRIDFSKAPTKLSIPSWSWMAYTGRIDYLKIDFGTYNWENIQSPWSQHESKWMTVDAETAKTALFAAARRYDLGAAKASEVDLTFEAFNFTFDAPKSLPPGSLCVVLGIAKGKETILERKHCVLIIAPTGEQDGVMLYERIGAGFLPGKCLAPPKPSFVQIC